MIEIVLVVIVFYLHIYFGFLVSNFDHNKNYFPIKMSILKNTMMRSVWEGIFWTKYFILLVFSPNFRKVEKIGLILKIKSVLLTCWDSWIKFSICLWFSL